MLDADKAATIPYLVTEYVPGDTLLQRVERDEPLQELVWVAVGAGLAAGLAAVHAAGVVHRDLTPANVILTTEGPKLIDLGVAAIEDSTRITRTGISFGTPSWMAPEQAQGQSVSAATDVFAWGAVMTFAATGRAPFGTGRAEAVLYRIVHHDPDLDGVPTELASTLTAALRKDPQERPSAAQLAAGLVGAVPDHVDVDALTQAVSSLIRTSPLPASTRRVLPADQQTDVVTPTGLGEQSSRRWVRPAAAALLIVTAAGSVWLGGPVRRLLIADPATAATSPATTQATATPPSSPAPSQNPEPGPPPTAAADKGASTQRPREAVNTDPPRTRVPRFESSQVVPSTQDAYELFALMRKNVGQIVYLDVRFPAGLVDVDSNASPAYIFVPGSYPSEDSPDFCSGEPTFCGAEYLVRDVGDPTDSGLYWMRQQWRLHGYFAVSSVEGPFQGSFSVSLRATPIHQVK